jgi:cell division protein FtsB
MKGHIVLSVGFYPHAVSEMHGEGIGITPEQKEALDDLHKRKIDLADEVYVLNFGGYIGSSTRSEIDYAIEHDKPIRYLESEQSDRGGKQQ